MEITNDVMKAINRYFHTLSNLGYKKDSDVNNLITYIFLEELLYSPTSQFITERDYGLIDKALYCLYGTSCLIPYPEYKRTHIDAIKAVPSEYRMSDEEVLRITEMDNIRVAT